MSHRQTGHGGQTWLTILAVVAAVGGIAFGICRGSNCADSSAAVGKSSEASAVVMQLSTRVDELRADNKQLREQLAAQAQQAKVENAKWAKLEADIAKSAAAQTKTPAAQASAASAKAMEGEDSAPDMLDSGDMPASTETLTAAFHDLAAKGMMGMQGGEALIELTKQFHALDAEGLDLLAAMLGDMSSSNNRFLASMIMEMLKDPRTVAPLAQALSDPDVMVRRMSSHALGTLGDAAAISALEQGAVDEDWGVRANSAYGLAKMGDDRGVLALRKLYDDMPANSPNGAGMLGGLADVGASAYADLFSPALADAKGDLTLRMMAFMWAGNNGAPELVPVLEGVIASQAENDSVKAWARKALEKIQQP